MSGWIRFHFFSSLQPLTSSHFPPKKLTFLHQKKPLGTQCLCAKYFLKVHLFGKVISPIVYLLCWHNNYQHIVASIVWYSKTYITHKWNLRINWKFGCSLFCLYLLSYVIKNHVKITNQYGPLIKMLHRHIKRFKICNKPGLSILFESGPIRIQVCLHTEQAHKQTNSNSSNM